MQVTIRRWHCVLMVTRYRLTTLTFSVVRTPSLSLQIAVCRTVGSDRQPRTLVTNSYIEGDVDIVSGRGAVVFDNTEFRVVNSRTQQEAYVFAPATLSNIYYGFLAVNSRFNAFGDGVAQLGRPLDADTPIPTAVQTIKNDSAINEEF